MCSHQFTGSDSPRGPELFAVAPRLGLVAFVGLQLEDAATVGQSNLAQPSQIGGQYVPLAILDTWLLVKFVTRDPFSDDEYSDCGFHFARAASKLYSYFFAILTIIN